MRAALSDSDEGQLAIGPPPSAALRLTVGLPSASASNASAGSASEARRAASAICQLSLQPGLVPTLVQLGAAQPAHIDAAIEDARDPRVERRAARDDRCRRRWRGGERGAQAPSRRSFRC